MKRVLALAALAACSSPAPPTTPTPPAPAIDAGLDLDAVEPPPPVAAAPLTDDDCGRYVDHVLAIGLEAMRASRSAELVPTPEQIAESRARLLATGPCRELPREAWTCALAARDQAGLYACAEGRE